jgi:dipeptidyl aminopeptidase/acylaminoacyl peptidase
MRGRAIFSLLLFLINLGACANNKDLSTPTLLWSNSPGITRVPVEALRLYQISLSPDGRAIAATVDMSAQLCPAVLHDCVVYHLFVIDAVTGEAYQLTQPGEEGEVLADPFWSPDGQKIGFITSDGVRLTNLERTEQFLLPRGLGACWSPDGHKVAVAHQARHPGMEHLTLSLKVYDLNTGRGEIVFETSGYLSQSGMAWSPDGQYIAFTWRETIQSPNVLYVIKVDNGKATPVFQPKAAVGPPGWTADSQWIMYPSEKIYFVHRDGQCQIAPLQGWENIAVAMSWHGDMMVALEFSRRDRKLYLVNLNEFWGADFLERLSCP